jgi:hypothetical protein
MREFLRECAGHYKTGPGDSSHGTWGPMDTGRPARADLHEAGSARGGDATLRGIGLLDGKTYDIPALLSSEPEVT